MTGYYISSILLVYHNPLAILAPIHSFQYTILLLQPNVELHAIFCDVTQCQSHFLSCRFWVVRQIRSTNWLPLGRSAVDSPRQQSSTSSRSVILCSVSASSNLATNLLKKAKEALLQAFLHII